MASFIQEHDEDINEIQNWCRNKRFLPKNLRNSFIHTFLLGCGGDKEKTKKVLENYFCARQSIPEIFTRRDPLLKENVHFWKVACFVPLKGKQNGCLVFVGTCLNSSYYDYTSHIKQMFMCFDLLIKSNQWGNGDRMIILSYDQIKYENLPTFNTYITRKTCECERENYLPGKLRAIHNVNIPPFWNKIYQKFKPFLSPEQQRTVILHKTLKSLHNSVNPEILPLEFGGAAGPLKNIVEKWCDVLKSHRRFFVEEEEKRMQETRVMY